LIPGGAGAEVRRAHDVVLLPPATTCVERVARLVFERFDSGELAIEI
jgi:hypothetical protein